MIDRASAGGRGGGMTRERLKQWGSLKKEVALLEYRLEQAAGRQVADRVQGSQPEFPYAAVNIRVEGADWMDQQRLLRRKQALRREQAALEDFIEALENSTVRRLVEKRYLQTKSWVQIAMEEGGGVTSSCVRMTVSRALEQWEQG